MSAVSSYLLISSRLLSIHLRLGRPLLLFPGTTMSIIFLDMWSSSLLLICPYKFNHFCLRNVDIWHTLASSCMIWFLTWSFLVLPLIHRSILISATCNLILVLERTSLWANFFRLIRHYVFAWRFKFVVNARYSDLFFLLFPFFRGEAGHLSAVWIFFPLRPVVGVFSPLFCFPPIC